VLWEPLDFWTLSPVELEQPVKIIKKTDIKTTKTTFFNFYTSLYVYNYLLANSFASFFSSN
jgi:hypothetical protein